MCALNNRGRSFRAFLTGWLIYDSGCGMPRLARLDAPGVLHHVMGRGIERRKIFWNDKDRNDFIDRLAGAIEQGGMDIYAWALIPNHALCRALHNA